MKNRGNVYRIPPWVFVFPPPLTYRANSIFVGLSMYVPRRYYSTMISIVVGPYTVYLYIDVH